MTAASHRRLLPQASESREVNVYNLLYKTLNMNALASVSRFVGKTFAFWVLLFALLAYLSPSTFIIFLPYVSILLGIVMFGMGLTLSVADFKEVFTRPLEVLIGVVGQFVIMPLSAYLLCLILGLPADIALGVILVGCCPGGTASNVMTFLARGDVALSVTITSCTTLLAPIVTPFLIYLFANQWISINPTAMFWSICQIVLLPIIAGVVVKSLLKDKVKAATTVLPLVSAVAIVLILAAVVAASHAKLATTGLQVFAVVVLHNSLGLAFGFLLGKLFHLDVAKCKCLSIEIGMQNSGLGVALANAHFAAMPLAALPSAIFSFWHNVSGAVIANIYARMQDKKTA